MSCKSVSTTAPCGAPHQCSGNSPGRRGCRRANSAGYTEAPFTGLFLGELLSAVLSTDLHAPVSIVGRARGLSPDLISSEGTCKEVSLGGKRLGKADTEISFAVCPLRACTPSNAQAAALCLAAARGGLSGRQSCSQLQVCVRPSVADSPDSAL